MYLKMLYAMIFVFSAIAYSETKTNHNIDHNTDSAFCNGTEMDHDTHSAFCSDTEVDRNIKSAFCNLKQGQVVNFFGLKVGVIHWTHLGSRPWSDYYNPITHNIPAELEFIWVPSSCYLEQPNPIKIIDIFSIDESFWPGEEENPRHFLYVHKNFPSYCSKETYLLEIRQCDLENNKVYFSTVNEHFPDEEQSIGYLLTKPP